MSIFEDKVILITGGAGSIGRNLVKTLLFKHNAKIVRIFDINENQLFSLTEKLENHPNARYFIGDIRDTIRLRRAMENVDIVCHLSALKHVSLVEMSPFEGIKTNVLGTQNVLEAAIDCNVQKVLNISSDKAVESCNVYGISKYLTEKLTLAANNYKGDHPTIFANARLCNVVGSDESLYPIWERCLAEKKPLPVTHPEMERYFCSMDDAIDFIVKCFNLMKGGETFVPLRAERKKIIDLAKQLSENIEIIGIRKGEKLSEKLMTIDEANTAKIVDGIWVLNNHE